MNYDTILNYVFRDKFARISWSISYKGFMFCCQDVLVHVQFPARLIIVLVLEEVIALGTYIINANVFIQMSTIARGS